MKRKSLFVLVVLLTATIFTYAAEETNNNGPLGITDKTINPQKLHVSGFDPADMTPRNIELKKVPDYRSAKYLQTSRGDFLTGKIPDDGLTEQGKEAVSIAPKWLRDDLADLFKRLENEDRQNNWAELIIEHEGEKYIDELIFTIAHSAAGYMKQAFANYDAYLQNSQVLYDIDTEIPYADIVDYGTPGIDDDYYSTIKYWTLNAYGEKVQREYDRNLYYWYVVHPKLSDEEPDVLDSGLFWRSYLYYDVIGKNSYSTFSALKNPNSLTEEDVSGWGYSSYGYFVGRNSWIVPIIRDKETGEGVLVSYHKSNGSVLATMMPVDKVENEAQEKLLENMVFIGKGEASINQMLYDPSAKIKFAIFKDKDPWGTPAVENAIKKLGNQYQVYTSAEMATFELPGNCRKIIIPSDQTREFYEALSENKDRFDGWINQYNSFEFHGACSPENDWSDLTMPGGLTCVPQSENMIDELEFNKFPTMQEVLPLADVVWDTKVQSLPIGRAFEEGNTAIDIIANWAGYNLPYNALSIRARPVQPELIAYWHGGNCGEIQDLIAAAGRVAMVPMSCTDGFMEDHVWNEFYDDGWFFLNNGWYGGGASIARAGGGQDKDYGGGKNISCIRRNRGDRFNEDITEHYTNNCTLEVYVYDKNGYPVDGANVQIYSEWYYDENSFVKFIEYCTDSNGFTSFVLGDNRNYYVKVESPVGKHPVNDIVQVIETSEPDMLYSWDCHLGGEIEMLKGSKIDYEPGNAMHSLVIELETGYEYIYGSSKGNSYSEPSDTAKIDYFVCDYENLVKYISDESFEAIEYFKDVNSGSTYLYIDEKDKYFVVISNEKHVMTSQEVSLVVQFNDENGSYIENLDSYETNYRLHSGERIIVGVNNSPPVILAAGFFDSQISHLEGGNLNIKALVIDPDGYDDIDYVELIIDDEKTGKFFRDDGEKSDDKAGDSLFSYMRTIFAKSMEKGLYKNYGIAAVDIMGLESTYWPYLHVVPNDSSLMCVEPQAYPLNNPLSTIDDALSFFNFYSNLNQYSSNPVILAGGYGNTKMKAESGGLFTIMAALPSGGNTYKVEMLFNETPLGIYLSDLGTNGDINQGDGVYTFSMNFKNFPAGDFIIELQAEDNLGNKSTIFPYFEVTE